MAIQNWHQLHSMLEKKWTCGHCGLMVGGNRGYFGAEIAHLPKDVESLYREARNCISVAAPTASVLACRKLLMNVAVSQGAPPNGTFQSYVTYLAANGYVPPNAKGWVDHIREKGNEATHEIPPVKEPDAKDLLTFMEMILKLVYEFPNRIPGHGSTSS